MSAEAVGCIQRSAAAGLAMQFITNVWKFFTVPERDAKLANCLKCNEIKACGGRAVKSFNTTSLKQRLKSKRLTAENEDVVQQHQHSAERA